MPDPRTRHLLILVACVALATRMAVVLPRIGGRVEDPDHYVDLAHSLARSHRFAFITRPTAYRPPLYPFLLAPLVGKGDREPVGPLLSTKTEMTWPIAVVHLILGAGTAVFTATAAQRFGLPKLAIVAAGLVVALDPLLVIQSRSIMTETLAAFLVSWAIAAAARGGTGSHLETGFVLGLAALCRPSLLAGAALALAVLFLLGPDPWRKRMKDCAIIAVMMIATLSPWAIRNRLVFGEFVWTTTHGGYTLALANNADYYKDVVTGPPGAVWDEVQQRNWALEISRATDGLSEPAADRVLSRSGWRMLRTQPRNFFWASMSRIGRFWAIAPSPAVYGWWTRLAATLWNVPLFVLGAMGLILGRSWRWPRSIIPAFLIGLSIVHLFYWTDMRMRAPLIPAIALAFGMGILDRKKTREKIRNLG